MTDEMLQDVEEVKAADSDSDENSSVNGSESS